MYAETDKAKNDYYEEKRKVHDESFELASIGDRFIALIIDNIIAGIISGFIAMLTGRGEAGVVTFFLVQMAYQWYFLIERKGQTPGKMAMHLRVIKANGTPITSTDVVLRVVGYQINNFMGLGWIWAGFDANRQGWHDKLANTYVVKE